MRHYYIVLDYINVTNGYISDILQFCNPLCIVFYNCLTFDNVKGILSLEWRSHKYSNNLLAFISSLWTVSTNNVQNYFKYPNSIHEYPRILEKTCTIICFWYAMTILRTLYIFFWLKYTNAKTSKYEERSSWEKFWILMQTID